MGGADRLAAGLSRTRSGQPDGLVLLGAAGLQRALGCWAAEGARVLGCRGRSGAGLQRALGRWAAEGAWTLG
ncbi:hypothetical protein KRMM14A1004_41680 [Krasilnikovia sp. MM14-A1004]